MEKRRIFIGGNWKCNNSKKESIDLVTEVYNKIEYDPSKIDILVSPITLHLDIVQQTLNKDILLASQNVSRTGNGPFTGEISASQLKDFSISWTLVGHSERRSYFAETSEIVAEKLKNALKEGINVVLCIGESKEERVGGTTNDVLSAQLEPIWEAAGDNWDRIVIAYEPIWAIGTDLAATPEQAQETHKFIRSHVESKKGSEVAKALRVIYGGSVKPKNCESLIVLEDIDGFLVGGASLKSAFSDIISKVKVIV